MSQWHRSKTPRFIKPGEDAEVSAQVVDREQQSEVRLVCNNPYAALSLQQQRQRLPIFKWRNHILYLVEKYQCVVLVGETGCGKSTQVCQYLLETGYAQNGRIIGVTQPRRVAVFTLAARVAEEKGVLVGGTVGYAVRFDARFDPVHTCVKYMTDGLLLRELMDDPLLTKYQVIMIDEVHERTVNTDIVLGLLRKVIAKRPDLKVIVASATMDAERFRDYFNMNKTTDAAGDTSVIISVEGRTFPVNVFYAKSPRPDYVKAAVDAAMKIHTQESTGDILLFLTGQDEVEACAEMLRHEARNLRKHDRLNVVPLYAQLPMKEQMKAFDSSPAGSRKVVVATNIAETSLTIPGVVYVIDCGFVKLRAFNTDTGLESLVIVPISQASAEQRAGRAGRLRSGKVYRLYTEESFNGLEPHSPPEMQRCHLAPVILQLKALGIDNILRFHFPARPPSAAMVEGVELLYALGALDEEGELTDLGYKLAELPLPPTHGKALMASTTAEFDCVNEMLTIVAMLQVGDAFVSPTGQKHTAQVARRRLAVEEGDFLSMLNVYSEFERNGGDARWCGQNFVNRKVLIRAAEIRGQLLRYLKRFGVELSEKRARSQNIERCIVAGFFPYAAKLHYTGVYYTVREGVKLKVNPGSVIMYRDTLPEWVVYNEIMQESMRDVAAIKSDWLLEVAPHFYGVGVGGREVPEKRVRLG